MRILMFFHGGSSNRGCEAIVVSAIKVIKQKYNEAYIALASTQPDTDQHIVGLDEIIYHNQNRSIQPFSFNYFKNFFNVKLKNNQSVSYELIHKDIIDRIDDFDIFLSIGGDNYCYGDIHEYYYLNGLIKTKGKKLILWGASIGSEDLNNKKIEDLKRFDVLCIRESESEKALKSAGLNNVVLVADGAFLLDVEHLPLPDEWEEGNTIGFNYSPLVQNKIPASKPAVLALLHYIFETTTYKIAFTPHVIQEGNNDWVCMQHLMDEIDAKYKKRFFLLPDNLTASQYKGYIARMECFIGARTHATIAAYSTAVPPMVLGYSVKSIGIATDLFGFPKLVLDKNQLSNATILKDQFNILMNDKEVMRKQLQEILPNVKKLAYSANNYL